jgi:site-specific DNA-adenine methylase
MWSYYGSKANVVDLYPKPKHHKIREPFAGSARYSLEYFENDVLLVDKYEVVVRVWKWLQQCSPADVYNLPRPQGGEDIRNYTWSCEEEKLFMGFVVTYGAFQPGNIVSVSKAKSRGNFIEFTLGRISKNLYKIRHWDIRHGDYNDIPNDEATWFIDPPYQHGGHKYKCSNKKIDFALLRDWCMSRRGQVIVCENTKADWMDFKPMIQQRGSWTTTTEAIWSNEPTAYDHVQQRLIL